MECGLNPKVKSKADLTLRKTLRELLNQRGLSAAELSRRTGVPRSVLSDWLAGASPRNIDHLRRVAEAFQVSIETLCFGKDLSKDPPFAHWVEGTFEGRIRISRR